MKYSNKRRVVWIVGSISCCLILINYANLWKSIHTLEPDSKPDDSIPSPPGVIANLFGGIGNQLFIYAWAHSLAKEKGWPLFVFPRGATESRLFSPDSREFALDQFNILAHSFKLIDRSTFNKIAKDQLFYASDEVLLNKNNLSLPQYKLIINGGYCQSPLYWKGDEDEIQRIFKVSENSAFIKNLKSDSRLKSTIEMIEESESVAVHVRRGDMAPKVVHFSPSTFYKHAVRRMIDLLKERGKESPIFFVFTDEIQYARETFSGFQGLRFVFLSSFNTSSIQDLYLMRKCKHIIFANSTFGWWAAYFLEKGSVVITASFVQMWYDILWQGKESYKKQFGTMYHPKDWIVINPFTGNFMQ